MSKKREIPHYGWAILAIGTLAIFGALGLARFGYSMVLPTMQGELGMDNRQAGLLATISLIGYLGLSIIGGPLAARYGVRLVATLGLVLAGAGMIFTGFSHSFISVAIWSGFTGIGSGAVNISIMGLLSAWFSRERRGLAAGIAVSGSSMGLIFTGFIVPLFITEYGKSAWHTCWYVFGSITLLLAVGAYLTLRNSPAEMGLNLIGADCGYQLPTKPGTKALQKTLQWKSVYLSPLVWYLGMVYMAFGFSYIIYVTFFVKYLIADCGYSGQAAGRLFMLMGWFSILCGLIWGAVSDLIGRKNTLIILYLVHTVAFSLFALGNSPVFFILSAIFYGLTAWSIPAIMAATCGDFLGPELAPVALGFITLFFGIGQAVGPVAAGAVADAAGSFAPVFLLASAAALLGAGGSAFFNFVGRRHSPLVCSTETTRAMPD